MKNECLLGLLPFVLCSCASAKTSVKPSNYDENAMTIHSASDTSSEEYVLAVAKRQAAMESNSKGMDCFTLRKGSKITPRELKSTRTMHGRSSAGSFSYEVPTDPYWTSYVSALLFVSFHDYDECKNLEKTEQKVFYNNETIKNTENAEIKQSAEVILIWGLVIGIPVLLLVLL
jgi:hypothetical protein